MELDIDSVLKERKFFQKIKCGDDGKKDTPVPISNTEVKFLNVEGTSTSRTGRIENSQTNKITRKSDFFV